MRFFPLIFVIILLLNGPVGATQTKSIWKKFLPQQISKSEKYSQNECAKIDRYGELNPELIYVYLEHLKRKFTLKISDPDSNYQTYFGYLLNWSKMIKNKWAQRELQHIDRKEISFPLVKERLSRFFTKYASSDYALVIKDSVPSHPDYDPNLSAYFKFLFFSQTKEPYNPKTNYEHRLGLVLKKMGDYFSQYFTKGKSLTKIQRHALIKKAFKYSYIFANSYLSQYEQTHFTLSDFIYPLILPEFINHSRLLVDLTYTSLEFNFEKAITFADVFGTKYSTPVKGRYDIFPWFGFRYALTKAMRPFSMVSFKFGFALKPSLFDSDDRLVEKVFHSNDVFFVKGYYFIQNIRAIRKNAFAAQITTPVLFFTNNFYLEAGLFYCYTSIRLKYDFRFDGIAYDYSSQNIPEYYSKGWSGSATSSKYKIKPIVNLNYAVFDFLTIYFDYLIYKDYNAGIRFSYRF